MGALGICHHVMKKRSKETGRLIWTKKPVSDTDCGVSIEPGQTPCDEEPDWLVQDCYQMANEGLRWVRCIAIGKVVRVLNKGELSF